MDFVVGGLAAMGAGVFSNPFDVVKTRMQLQGELAARGKHAIYYKNAVHAAYVIGKNEGIRGLQKGLGAALMMHSVRNSSRLGLYQWLNKNGYLTDSGGRTVFYKSFIGSSLSGALGAFLGSPLFMIKTQLQSKAADTIAVGTQHGHTGVFSAFRTIYSQNGVFGLWRGCYATMLRAIAGSSSQLTSFALAKDVLRQNEHLVNYPVLLSLVASMFGGIVQTLVMQPFDLISIRLYNQGTDKLGRGLLYTGIPDCFFKVWRAEGVLGFYKGIGANYMRLAPHSAFTLVFWDILKDLQHKYIDKTHTTPKFGNTRSDSSQASKKSMLPAHPQHPRSES